MDKPIEKDSYGIPLDKPWRDVRFKDDDVEFNLMDWQAKLQTELGIERLSTKQLRERIRFVIEILPSEETEAIMVLMAALGDEKCCECSHSPDHGACDDFKKGMNGRCVYCDHDEKCHPGNGETFNLPLGVGTRTEV